MRPPFFAVGGSGSFGNSSIANSLDRQREAQGVRPWLHFDVERLARIVPTRPARDGFIAWLAGSPIAPLVVARFEVRLTTEASAAGSSPAALCRGGRAATYYGSRGADGTYALDASSGLAVLERCGPNCAVSVSEHVTGTVAGEGAAATFNGTLVERFEYLAGQCGDCALPCAATYSLTTITR